MQLSILALNLIYAALGVVLMYVSYRIIDRLTPEVDFPALRNGYSLQFYVKAYRKGDPALAGVAGTRLVQVPLAR